MEILCISSSSSHFKWCNNPWFLQPCNIRIKTVIPYPLAVEDTRVVDRHPCWWIVGLWVLPPAAPSWWAQLLIVTQLVAHKCIQEWHSKTHKCHLIWQGRIFRLFSSSRWEIRGSSKTKCSNSSSILKIKGKITKVNFTLFRTKSE